MWDERYTANVQVCPNGHINATSLKPCPKPAIENCNECGLRMVNHCGDCGWHVDAFYTVEHQIEPLMVRIVAPPVCGNCGARLPWFGNPYHVRGPQPPEPPAPHNVYVYSMGKHHSSYTYDDDDDDEDEYYGRISRSEAHGEVTWDDGHGWDEDGHEVYE